LISRKADLAEKPHPLEFLRRGPLPENGAKQIHKAGTSELICEMRMTRFFCHDRFHKAITAIPISTSRFFPGLHSRGREAGRLFSEAANWYRDRALRNR
jgi:hypothetical protein